MYNGYGYPPPHQAQQPSWQAQTPHQQYGYKNVGDIHQAPPYGGPGGYIQPMQQHIPNPAYTAPAPAPVPPQYGLSQQAGHNSYYAGAPPVSHSAYPAPPLHAPQPTIPPFYLGAKLAADPFAPTATVPASLPGYDPSSDVDVIRKATKGFGTDENALNRVLCLRSAEEIQVLLQAYRSRHGKDLIDLLKKETSGYYERTLVALATGPLVGDVELLHDAIAGAGTKESIVTEILVGRHPNEMLLLRHAYERRYHKSMDKEILDDLSFKTKDAFSIVLQGRWQDNGCVQHDLIERDLHDLLPAFRFGFTNEMLICSIIFARSPVYLQALVPAFKQRDGKSLTNQIKQHFSGHLQDALLFAVEGGKRDGMGIWRDAKRLEAAMKGAGTKDILLIARIVRGHWDRNRFEQIKLAYQQKYKKALLTRVQGETSGHYRDCLLTIVKGH